VDLKNPQPIYALDHGANEASAASAASAVAVIVIISGCNPKSGRIFNDSVSLTVVVTRAAVYQG
jgi:hypothetical protein